MRFLRVIWGVLLLAASGAAAFAQTLTAVTVNQTDAATEVQLSFDQTAREADNMFAISEGKPRIVLDYKDADYSIVNKGNRVAGTGAVASVRFARRGRTEDDLRLVIDLNSKNLIPAHFISGNILTLIFKSNAPPSEPVLDTAAMAAPLQTAKRYDIDAPRYFKGAAPYPRLKPQSTTKTPSKPPRKPVIVIDPGHGGYDPGAIGAAGTREKVITYAASLELQSQLIATGRYDVIVTRKKDVYVAHEERLRIARAGGADLFISIHADATASGSARGASVYTLADRAVNRSKRIVNSQNWIMDVDLSEQSDPVGDILVDLAQRKTASQSDEFAESLIAELSNSTHLIGNTHRRAGYFVLLAPDVPAVLLELGFIANAQDEALLNNKTHRKKVLKSVTRAINLHFDKQKS